MSVEENKAIVRRWNEETINKGNFDIIDELADVNYIDHNSGLDREGYKQFSTAIAAAFSDGGIAIEDVIAEGDRVVIRWKMHGTHTGEYMGVPATGKVIMQSGISIYRIANGKIVEDWSCGDMVGVMQQLGLIPPMG